MNSEALGQLSQAYSASNPFGRAFDVLTSMSGSQPSLPFKSHDSNYNHLNLQCVEASNRIISNGGGEIDRPIPDIFSGCHYT